LFCMVWGKCLHYLKPESSLLEMRA
jgi:hypothetical protein